MPITRYIGHGVRFILRDLFFPIWLLADATAHGYFSNRQSFPPRRVVTTTFGNSPATKRNEAKDKRQ